MKNKQLGFSAIEIAIGIIVLGIVGLLGWKFISSMQNSSAQRNAATEERQQTVLDEGDLAGLASIETIKKSALSENEAATVTGIELSSDDGKLVYSASLSDGTIVTYDAMSGAKIASERKEAAEDSAKSLPADFNGGIGIAKAIETGKSALSKTAVIKVEVESDDGKVLYSIRFADGSRVDVDARTGAVVRTALKTEKTESEHKEKKSTSKNEDSTKSSSSSKGSSSGKSKTENSSKTHSSDSESSDDENEDEHSGSGSSGGGHDSEDDENSDSGHDGGDDEENDD